MTDKELRQLGVVSDIAKLAAKSSITHAVHDGFSAKQIRKAVRAAAHHPEAHCNDPHFAPLAEALIRDRERGVRPTLDSGVLFGQESRGVSWRQWGRDLDPAAVRQMQNACRLPVSVRGALMPDAHVGYGLPIGGVLATKNAVIPWAVGVDIACRMKLSVLDWPMSALDDRVDELRRAIDQETRFGVGAEFKKRRQHEIMDSEWSFSPVTRELKDKAWAQLGTSGSGNHFVEFGSLEISDPAAGLAPGLYLALLSHSGSRGTGAQVCEYYSRIAQKLRHGLPDELKHLAWLGLDTAEGLEYWHVMQLMGNYAAANHALIHRYIAANLGAQVLLDIENHHNFAWKEKHDGREVIVHRKGATPAAKGVVGIIPGSMATPGYVIRGKGNPESLESASHGAGRVMSRTQAKKQFRWEDAMRLLRERGVTLMSAGLDEVPMVYKNIDEVMAAQTDLVEVLAKFMPRLVKMSPAGERPED